MMKKWISLLCVSMLIIGMITVSFVGASAEESSVDKANTAVDVKSGDEVTYTLVLDKVDQPIIGSDFSVYYDSSVFDLVSVADYNDNTDPEEWTAVINPDLDGEVRGVWSILKGVDFSSKRNFITLNLKAVSDAKNTHISYRIRFLYGNDYFTKADKPQINKYEFTCNVSVNSNTVLEGAAPQWNEEEPEENGQFIPSYDGNSEHADASIPGVVNKAKKSGNGKAQSVVNNAVEDNAVGGNSGGSANGGSAGGSANGGSAGGSANGGSAGGSANGGSAGGSAKGGNAGGSAGENANGDSAAMAPPATTAEGYYILATDSDGNVTATSDEAPEIATADNAGASKGSSPVLWIIIVLVVLAGGGAAVYFYMKKQKAAAPAGGIEMSAPSNEDAPTTELQTPSEEDPKTELADEEDEKTQIADDSIESEDK